MRRPPAAARERSTVELVASRVDPRSRTPSTPLDSQASEEGPCLGKFKLFESGTDVTITLNADTATISAGGKGQGSELFLSNAAGAAVVFLSTKPRHLMFRADATAGNVTGPVMLNINAGTPEVTLFGAGGGSGEPKESTVHLRGTDATVRAGGNGVDGRVLVLGKDSKARISLEGSTGDIVLSNADCAEEFDVDEDEDIAPGTVMILDNDDKLRKCAAAYDRRVAGVFSGAGDTACHRARSQEWTGTAHPNRPARKDVLSGRRAIRFG